MWGKRESFNYPFNHQMTNRMPSLSRPFGFYCDDDSDSASIGSALMTAGRVFERQSDGRPMIKPDVAYHVENEKLVDYFERVAALVGVTVEDETVEHVDRHPSGDVAAVIGATGRRFTADLFVDCSGFASALLGKTLGEPLIEFKSSLLCDRAVVGGWARPDGDPIRPYTTAETMSAGWSWQIEHEHRVNRGYVYCPAFISDDDAEAEFRNRNPLVGDTRVVKFVSGRRERGWVGNVFAIGNAYGFVEPLEATALTMICEMCRSMANLLFQSDRRPGDGARLAHNRRFARKWDAIRWFLAVHYKFNDRAGHPVLAGGPTRRGGGRGRPVPGTISRTSARRWTTPRNWSTAATCSASTGT